MNRSTKLKPLAPRPAVDQNCQQNMGYSSCPSVPADGRGSVNRNAFVGAHLGLHASPLEAVTSMDPKDYVWGGGNYNASFYGCPSAFTGAQPCYYPSAAEYPVSYGYANPFQSVPGIQHTGQYAVDPMCHAGSAADSSRGDLSGVASSLCDTQTSEHENIAQVAPLDSKVDDLLDLDDEALKKMLSPENLDEAAGTLDAEDSGSCKKPRRLESMASGDSQVSGSEEVILPDFGEGFGNSDGLLVDVSAASPLTHESGMGEVSPYLSPLLHPPTLPSSATVAGLGSAMLQACTDRRSGQSKKEAVANLLSDMSMADAVQCITQFLRCDKRIADDKRQAAATAVQAVCSSRSSLVVTLRQPVVLKPQLKRKRSSTKALEAARNSA